MIKKKILICLAIIIFILSNIFFVNIEAKEIITLMVYQDKDHIAYYYKGKPDVNAGQDIQNLKITYNSLANTYELELLGDVTLNPVLCSGISSISSNIKIIGSGVLTINYHATVEGIKEIEEQGTEMTDDRILSLIYCENKSFKYVEDQETKDLCSLLIGNNSDIEEEKSNITLNLNTIIDDEVVGYIKSDGSYIHSILTSGLCGDNIYINNSIVNEDAICYGIKAENDITIKNSKVESKYRPEYCSSIIGTFSINGKTTIDNSICNITMEDDQNPESFCTAHYADNSSIDIVNGSVINVISPYRVFADAPMVQAKEINIEDSECNLVGSWISLAGKDIKIKNSDFLFDAYYGNIALIEDNVSINISEDNEHGGVLTYNTIVPGNLYNGIIMYDKSMTNDVTIDVNVDEDIRMLAYVDENDKKEISSIDDIINNTTYKYFEIEKKHRITFMDGDNELEEYRLVILPNNKIKKPADPTKEGYKFDGWYADSDFIKPFDFDNTLVTQNLTLYSKWIKIEEQKEEDPHHSDNNSYNIPKTGIK